ncbi:MAG: hypothetical protein HWE13_15420 [Gammaproteobacteria bacterium]|nr:hypothetical protein [Gammaproteobacteria bacterium]
MNDALINAELGTTDDPFRVDRAADLKLACYRMFAQAQQSVNLFTYELDPRVLSDREIESVLAKLARRSRHTQIRMMVYDTTSLQSNNHRLIGLYQALSSYVAIKVVAKEHQQIPYSFYTVDDCGLIYRPNHHEFESQIYFNDKLKTKDYRKQFEEYWEQGRVASEFRVLGI